MNVLEGDLHDPCVATYQCLEADQLNVALKTAGITDCDKRREIIEHFLFDAGYFRDSCWFEQEGRRFRPVMCFEEVSGRKGDQRTLLVPDPALDTLFHEYAHGAAAWLFDEVKEDAFSIAAGDVEP